jgi:DNA-binding transcriptional LysR family regulator
MAAIEFSEIIGGNAAMASAAPLNCLALDGIDKLSTFPVYAALARESDEEGRMLTERQLEYVVAIAETGTFTAAAERCHVAQSALSHQISSLERHLRARLFERSSRSVRLTEAGRSLLPVARRVLGEMAGIRDELRSIDPVVRGPLRIGAAQTAVRVLDLPRMLVDYDRAYPEVDVSVSSGARFELVSGLRSAEFDVALAALDGPVLPPRVSFVPFGHLEPLVVVVSGDHQLAGRRCVRFRELAAASRFVDFQPGTALQNKIRAMAEAAGAERRVMCELGTIAEMVRMAATGAAVAIVPRVFTEDIKGQPGPPDGISVVRLAEPDSYLTLGLFCNRDRAASAAVRAFLDLFNTERHLAPAPGLLGGYPMAHAPAFDAAVGAGRELS